MKPHNALTADPILPTIWRLSLPNMVAMVATAEVSIAETTYIGQLGTLELAGIALVLPMIMLQQMLSAGSMGGGITSAISRALGTVDNAKANALVLHATVISVALGLLFSALFLIWGRPIFSLIGGGGVALDHAMAYANMAFLGATSIWLTNAFASAIRGSGNMQTPSMTLILVAVGQVLLGGALGLIGGAVAVFTDAWSTLFTTHQSVLANARVYFLWAGPCYAFFGFGLCLYFAFQGAGKLLGRLAGAGEPGRPGKRYVCPHWPGHVGVWRFHWFGGLPGALGGALNKVLLRAGKHGLDASAHNQTPINKQDLASHESAPIRR